MNKAKAVLLDFFTKFLSPPYCIGCQDLLEEYTVLCRACHEQLPQIFSHTVAVTSSQNLKVHTFTAYQKPVDMLIQAKLSSRHTPVVQLAYLVSEHIRKQSLVYDIVVPIPLHWQRFLWRGFNQAEVLADKIAVHVKAKIVPALTRKKRTLFQSTLSAAERKDNVAHAFKVPKKYTSLLKNKRVVLIDDLYTTGATAIAAARELYKHGAESVELIVACKVIH